MSLKKSVLSALILLSSLTSLTAQADFDRRDPRRDPRPDPRCDSRDPWCDNRRDDRRDRLDLIVEQDIRRYFDQRSSLDLLIDSYTRSQLLGRKVREIRISMATELGRGQANLLVNNRQLEASVIVARDVREYSFRVEPFSNEVGRSLRSLSLEMQGRFYVDRAVFVLEEDRGSTDPFPRPSQTEVVRSQVNQVIDREGGINLFRQLPLLERQGKIVKRVNVVAISRFGMGSIMLLENNESFGQTAAVSPNSSRVTFELTRNERIGYDLQSLRLQANGSMTILEVSVELEDSISNDGPWGGNGDIIRPTEPRDPRIPRR
jgi:hypothetical protein